MTISTYSELLSAIDNYTHRADLASRADEFIDNVEAKLNRRLRLRTMETVVTGTFTADTATLALPADFLEERSFSYEISTDVPVLLEPVTLESGDGLEYGQSGAPAYYAHNGDSMRLYPTPDSAYSYTLRYYKKLPALSSSQTTNWVLTNFPDAYLYGVQFEAFVYVRDTEGAMQIKPLFDMVVEEIKRHDRAGRFKGPPRALIDPVLLGGRRSNITTDS